MKEYSCVCTITVNNEELKRLLDTCDLYFSDEAKRNIIRSVIFSKNATVSFQGLTDKILCDYKEGNL